METQKFTTCHKTYYIIVPSNTANWMDFFCDVKKISKYY